MVKIAFLTNLSSIETKSIIRSAHAQTTHKLLSKIYNVQRQSLDELRMIRQDCSYAKSCLTVHNAYMLCHDQTEYRFKSTWNIRTHMYRPMQTADPDQTPQNVSTQFANHTTILDTLAWHHAMSFTSLI